MPKTITLVLFIAVYFSLFSCLDLKEPQGLVSDFKNLEARSESMQKNAYPHGGAAQRYYKE